MTNGKRLLPKRETFFLTVEPQFEMSQEELMNHVHNWLETHAHTSVASGFELKAVSISGHKYKEFSS